MDRNFSGASKFVSQYLTRASKTRDPRGPQAVFSARYRSVEWMQRKYKLRKANPARGSVQTRLLECSQPGRYLISSPARRRRASQVPSGMRTSASQRDAVKRLCRAEGTMDLFCGVMRMPRRPARQRAQAQRQGRKQAKRRRSVESAFAQDTTVIASPANAFADGKSAHRRLLVATEVGTSRPPEALLTAIGWPNQNQHGAGGRHQRPGRDRGVAIDRRKEQWD